MPEDQGVDGDAWNNEASKLMKLFNWEQVGDGNIDVYNEDGKPHGVDRIFKYYDVKTRKEQTIFLEAKRYLTTSFSKNALQDWINTLDHKITKCKNSESLYETYPYLEGTVVRTGVIAIWFHDHENYKSFRPSFEESLIAIRPPTKYSLNTNRLFVLDNFYISRLMSLYSTITDYKHENGAAVQFFYPASDKSGYPADTSNLLSIEYIYSQIILAEAKLDDGNEHKIVFYFGSLSINSFKRLKSFLVTYGYFDERKPLLIYYYERDKEFRKILPDIKQKVFLNKAELEEMNVYDGLAKFIKK